MNEPDTIKDIQVRATPLPKKASELRVIDAESYQDAAEFTLDLRAMRKEIDATFNPIIQKAHEVHKEALAQKKKIMDPVETAQRIVDGKISEYHEAEKRRVGEENERLRREAEERALREEEERRLAEAVRMEADGNRAMAEALLDAPVIAPVVLAPTVASQAPKVDGLSIAILYSAEVENLMVLVQAVAHGRAPLGLLQVNQAALNGMARALKDAFSVPGCRVVAGSSVRGGRQG